MYRSEKHNILCMLAWGAVLRFKQTPTSRTSVLEHHMHQGGIAEQSNSPLHCIL